MEVYSPSKDSYCLRLFLTTLSGIQFALFLANFKIIAMAFTNNSAL